MDLYLSVHFFKRMMVLWVLVVLPGGAWASVLIPQTSEEHWMNNLVIDLPTEADVMTADWNELECLAANIYHEARSESDLGQELVAQVTINRIRDDHYPDDACSVVREAYQFSWTHDGRSDAIKDRAAYEKAYRIAIKYLYLGEKASIANSQDLLNYHANYVSPDWYNLKMVASVGNHIFYKRG